MTGHRISDIADALSAPFSGDGDLIVQRAREPGAAGPGDLAVAMTRDYGDDLGKGSARAALLWQGADWQALGLKSAIFVKRPRLAMAALTGFLTGAALPVRGVHATAAIDPSAVVGDNCYVGPNVVIGAGTTIGAGTCIQPNTTIGNQVYVGRNCMLGAGVVIADNVNIGDHLFAHPGAVIGADGFSFVTAEPSPAEAVQTGRGDAVVGIAGQKLQKIHSLGGVEIGDDVEIGANSTIDAGTLRATSIGDGTKIDALVHIGHNVRIGRDCLLCGHVGVGGSAIIGDGVVLGGQAGVADNITIGDGVVAGGASKIMSNVKAGRVILGYPAVGLDKHIQGYRALYRLPKLLRDLAANKKSVPTGDGKD